MSLGAAATLQTRLRELADGIEVFICKDTGYISDDVSDEIGYVWCRACRGSDCIRSVMLAFGTLLMTSELLSLGISVRFDLADLPNMNMQAM